MNNHEADMRSAALNAGMWAETYLESAWVWLCRQRATAPADADIWHLRYHQETEKKKLLQQLLCGQYRLSPVQVVGRGAERRMIWCAWDALVVKWVALQIAPRLPLHVRCEHVKGHGGGAASVARLSAALQQGEYPWVMRTDVLGYYGSLDKTLLLKQVDRHVPPGVLNDLVHQYVHYTVELGGTFYTPETGICRGCALSPLMGALYLREMDGHFGLQPGIVYARYMDDIVILAKTRWQLRKQVRDLNQQFAQKGLCQHPDKTFIGRTSRGFDWMGAWLSDAGAEGVAPRAWNHHREKVRRLYERAWRRRETKSVTRARVSAYRLRWTIWAMALLGTTGGDAAVTLTAVVPAGQSGIVGATPTVTTSLSGPLGSGLTNHVFGFPAVSSATSRCAAGASVGDSPRGFIATPASGRGNSAILLVDGSGEWQRRNSTGEIVKGTVSAVRGVWSTTTTYPSSGDVVTSGSDTNGVFGSGFINCPYAAPTPSGGGLWDPDYIRSSSLAVRFMVYAPAGGLSPGDYNVPPVYHGDYSNVPRGDLSAILVDGIKITVMSYGCTLIAPTSVVFTGAAGSVAGPEAVLNAGVVCADTAAGVGSPTPIDVTLSFTASGASWSERDAAQPQRLPVAGTGGIAYVLGGWGQVPAENCGGGDVYWDGRSGPTIGRVEPGQQGVVLNKNIFFRLCDSDKLAPGSYTAQATLSVVQR
ncbi:reverse transcriptase domain-containing protein [Enterobacter cloacae]|uniref:reverse transcriptase domain-containing protein n=1 Tax=Enterobacter cloacae TaxID=550 RepID=UPI002B1E92DC|nr:reverse transcriptase domain-containing protein [Enterobacter cloacae]MEA5217575.1 reverse transcriptase domain-containing protein [Enterobacter cloacae]